MITAGQLRSRLQPIVFLRLTSRLGDFEDGDEVAVQFWGEGYANVTPLPRAAAAGHVPGTFLVSTIAHVSTFIVDTPIDDAASVA